MNRTATMFVMLGLTALGPAPGKALAAPERQPEVAPLSAADLEAGVRRAFGGYEPVNSAAALQTLAQMNGNSGVTGVLLRLIKDPATPGVLRLQAIEGLGAVPTEFGRLFLHGVLSDLGKPGAPDDDRMFTLAAAVRALGSFSAIELPSLTPYLMSANADVREAAATSVARCGAVPTTVLPLLQNRLTVESDRGVRETLRRHINSLNRQGR